MSEDIKRIVANFVGEYCCRLSGANEALVDIIQTQVEAERERCAKIAEDNYEEHCCEDRPCYYWRENTAKLIRNKPEKEDK